MLFSFGMAYGCVNFTVSFPFMRCSPILLDCFIVLLSSKWDENKTMLTKAKRFIRYNINLGTIMNCNSCRSFFSWKALHSCVELWWPSTSFCIAFNKITYVIRYRLIIFDSTDWIFNLSSQWCFPQGKNSKMINMMRWSSSS